MEKKEDKRHVLERLSDRMKQYEKTTMTYLDPTQPFIIRLDGHKFSSFTKGWKKPFDERIHELMVSTMEDLMLEFRPCICGYTMSDEITLVFPKVPPKRKKEHKKIKVVKRNDENIEKENEIDDEEKEIEESIEELKKRLIFSGRVQKIATLASGKASASFNVHLFHMCKSGIISNETECDLFKKLQESQPYFDARIFNVPSREESLNNIIWRHGHDWMGRNRIQQLGQHYFSKSQMHKKNSAMVEEMLGTKGIFLKDQPDWYNYGTFVKKQRFLKEIEIPISRKNKTEKKKISVYKTRLVRICEDRSIFNKENIEFVFSTYLGEKEKKDEEEM